MFVFVVKNPNASWLAAEFFSRLERELSEEITGKWVKKTGSNKKRVVKCKNHVR